MGQRCSGCWERVLGGTRRPGGSPGSVWDVLPLPALGSNPTPTPHSLLPMPPLTQSPCQNPLVQKTILLAYRWPCWSDHSQGQP